MKLAVFSDSHGRPERMLDAISRFSPDIVVHLGDGERDLDNIEEKFPQIPLKSVRGNCDLFSALPETQFFNVGKYKIFITHGHIFSVKSTRSLLVERAVQLGADIVMYGHTHIAEYRTAGTLHILNPGSCGLSSSPSFAEVEITEDGISVRIIRL
ncbi:MAG: metallophosphoesterase [Clostridiales bacterium]|nr:metallophosphoesterase [Clostridiales bacterium]